jgi:exopolyphosphatase/guanosine-5'-triphosphate,3'-diphosphate pyrophosphatase
VRVAAVDIGTNTVRLLVVDAGLAGIRELARKVTVTRLGHGVDSTGLLDPEAVARTIQVLAGYASIMDELGVTERRAIATSASRDAGNAAEFQQAVAAVLRVHPEVIDGDTEARLSFRGATHGKPTAGVTLVIDPGGGSTEFVAGDAAPIYACSVDIGSVRLTERHLGEHRAAQGDVAAARRHVQQLFAAEPALPAVDRVVGVAGTFTTLAAMHLELDTYSRIAVDGTMLSRDDLGRLTDRLATMSLPEIVAIPSMDPRRAPVVLGGALVAEEALIWSGHDQVVVSESDILDGVALSMLD